MSWGKSTPWASRWLPATARFGQVIPAFRGVLQFVLRRCYLGDSHYLKPWSFLKTDPPKTDPWVDSVLWGRIGGAALVLTAFILQGKGIVLGEDERQAAFGAVESVLAAAGVIMAIVSKYRQKAKPK